MLRALLDQGLMCGGILSDVEYLPLVSVGALDLMKIFRESLLCLLRIEFSLISQLHREQEGVNLVEFFNITFHKDIFT